VWWCTLAILSITLGQNERELTYNFYLESSYKYRDFVQVQPYSIAEKEDIENHKSDELYKFSNNSSRDLKF